MTVHINEVRVPRNYLNLAQTTTGRHLCSLGLIIALVLLIVGANPFRQTLAPMDVLLNYSGWENVNLQTPVVNLERSDALDHRLPNWREFRRELRDGRIPIWNPLHQLGAPGIQAPIYEGLSIPFLVYAVAPNEAVGYTLAILTNYLLAALGAYCLIYTMFSNRSAAIFGALVYAFCGFNIAWAHWPHLTTSALIPWVLACQLWYWQTGRMRWAVGLAFSVALLGLGGFPFVALLGVIASVLLGGVLFVAEIQKTGFDRALVMRVTGLGLAGLAGSFLAMPGLLQITDILASTDLSYRSGETLLTPYNLVHLLGFDFVRGVGVERTFSAGAPAAILAIAALYLVFRIPNRFAVFGLLMAGFVLATAFGMAPAKLIQFIPGFNSNPWSRTTILLGLTLAICSAYVISELLSRLNYQTINGKFIIACGSILLLIQVIQLSYQFQTFNSRPNISTYFPETPSITYVKNEIRPAQSIVAGESYFISGVLSNFQLPELLAHGFRTLDQEGLIGQLIPNFRSSPTATIAYCNRIDFGSKAISYAAIRFILVPSNCTNEATVETKGRGKIQTIPLNQGALQGTILISKPVEASRAEIYITTEKSGSQSGVSFDLFKDGSLIAHGDLPAEAVQDERWITFDFKQNVSLAAGSYQYVVTVGVPDTPTKIRAWAFETADGETYRIGYETFPGAPMFRFVTRSSLPQIMRKISVEPGIEIVENRAVTGSGYYVSTLAGQPDADYGSVHLASYAPDDVVLKYDGKTPGWVVLPFRTNENWRAVSDGAPVKIEQFLGLFPAVAVSGPSEVRYFYDTAPLLKRIGIGLVGFAVSIAVILWMNHKRRR